MGLSVPHPDCFLLCKNSVRIVQGAGWAFESLWMGVENLARLGFDPWTIQLTVSCYTNHTVVAHGRIVGHLNIR